MSEKYSFEKISFIFVIIFTISTAYDYNNYYGSGPVNGRPRYRSLPSPENNQGSKGEEPLDRRLIFTGNLKVSKSGYSDWDNSRPQFSKAQPPRYSNYDDQFRFESNPSIQAPDRPVWFRNAPKPRSRLPLN